MSQQACLYCGEEFIGKRSDAKFCTSTCKAKYWEEKKSDESATPKLSEGLRGIVDTQPKAPPKPTTIIKTIQVETEVYQKAKVEVEAIQTSVRRLEAQKTALLKQGEEIANRNGGIFYVGGALAGACIADKECKDKGKMLLGAAVGLFGGFIADTWDAKSREADKQKGLQEIAKKIKEIDVCLTSIRPVADKMQTTMNLVPRYETKTIHIPDFSSFLQAYSPKDASLPLLKESKAEPVLQRKAVILPPPQGSEKIISSEALQGMDYAMLDFQGKWNAFFGYPSLNFHCVLTGMSGEGKSTFAIQFASYLAENFGRVLYVSGEEGFSKTFKDKFINNNAVSPDLYVADLRSYDEIVKEILPDTYHFIFIDSLDNMRIDAEKMKQLRERYKESALITISQSTKDGKMRGSYEIVHDCDIGVKVESGVAVTTKYRFKAIGMEMKVFES